MTDRKGGALPVSIFRLDPLHREHSLNMILYDCDEKVECYYWNFDREDSILKFQNYKISRSTNTLSEPFKTLFEVQCLLVRRPSKVQWFLRHAIVLSGKSATNTTRR